MLLFWSLSVSAQEYEGLLKKPLVLGAWLYQGNCSRCHLGDDGQYLADNYSDKKELKSAFTGSNCRINWSRRGGGPFGREELDALSLFLLSWNEDGEYPDVGELPPQPVKKSAAVKPKNEKKITAETDTENPDALDDVLQNLIEKNPLAEGGYLYTQNCYRCHLAYKKARMGKGIERQSVLQTIREGKTSTQMKPFSRMLGGELKNSEIEHIADYVMTWEGLKADPAIAAELMIPPAFEPELFKPIRLPRFKEVTGDVNQGSRLFMTHCYSCHGRNGEGRIGPPLHRIYSLRPDLYVKSILKNGVPNSLMKSWSQNSGGHFSAKELDDTVSFLVQMEQ